MPSRRYLRFGLAELVTVTGCATVASFLLSWVNLASPGFVGMRHDWFSFAFADQIRLLAAGEWWGWIQMGLGESTAYPNGWVLWSLYGITSFLTPAMFVSKLTLLGVPATLMVSTYLLCRLGLSCSRLSAAVAAVFAGICPVTFNRIVAGQLTYLWAYSLLPLALLCYWRIRSLASWPWMLGTVLCLAAISSQIQFMLIFAVIVVIDLLTRPHRTLRSAFPALATVVATFAFSQGATIFSLLFSGTALQQSIQFAPGTDSIARSGTTFLGGLQLYDYFTRYFEQAQAALSLPGDLMAVAGWLMLLFLAWAAFASPFRQPTTVALILWIAGAYLSTAVNAPYSWWLADVYQHFRFMQLFREPYHWSALSELGAAMLVAFGSDTWLSMLSSRNFADVLRERQDLTKPSPSIDRALMFLRLLWTMRARLAISWIFPPLGLAGILVFCLPSLSGNWAYQVQNVRLSSDDMAAMSRARAGTGYSRILWLPMDEPLRVAGTRFAGSDPMTATVPYSAEGAAGTPPLPQIVMAFRSGHIRGLNRLLQYSAVSTIINRRDIRSMLPDFLYRRYPHQMRLYDSNANIRSIPELHWKCEDIGADRYCSSIRPNRLISIPSERALISPSMSVLGILPPQVTPQFSVDLSTMVQYVAYVNGDLPDMKAQLAPLKSMLLDQILIFASADAESGWAPLNSWWPYRADITTAFDASLLSLTSSGILRLHALNDGDILIVSYLCTVHGGHIAIEMPNAKKPIILSTVSKNGPWLRSASFRIRRGTTTVRNIDGEQVLRSIYEMSATDWRTANYRFDNLLRKARSTAVETAGLEVVSIPRTALYNVAPRATIDGRRVSGLVRLAGGAHVVKSSGETVIKSAGFGTSVQMVFATNLSMRRNGLYYSGTLPASAKLFCLRMRFSKGWKLLVDGQLVSNHTEGDLFSNVWSFSPSSRTRRFEVIYEPAVWIGAMHAAPAIFLAGSAMVLLMLGLRELFVKRSLT